MPQACPNSHEPSGKSSRANFQGDGERFSFSEGRKPASIGFRCFLSYERLRLKASLFHYQAKLLPRQIFVSRRRSRKTSYTILDALADGEARKFHTEPRIHLG